MGSSPFIKIQKAVGGSVWKESYLKFEMSDVQMETLTRQLEYKSQVQKQSLSCSFIFGSHWHMWVLKTMRLDEITEGVSKGVSAL